jgi:hypothetical protein
MFAAADRQLGERNAATANVEEDHSNLRATVRWPSPADCSPNKNAAELLRLFATRVVELPGAPLRRALASRPIRIDGAAPAW